MRPPAYVWPLIHWLRREGWRCLPTGHAARWEWADVAGRIDGLEMPQRAADELRLLFARRWARLYHALTGDDVTDDPGAEQPLLDEHGRPVRQLHLFDPLRQAHPLP